jgi:cell division protein FtsA
MRTSIKRIVTGIDVGTYATRVVVVEYIRGEAPRIIGTGISETRGLRHGYIVNKMDATRSISTAITHAEKMIGFKIKNAFLSVGGISLESVISTGSIIISRASGEVSEQDIKKSETDAEETLTNLVNKRIIYRIPLRYKLEGKEVLGNPNGMIGTKLETKMLFVTCLEQHLEDIIKTIEEIGIEVDEVVPSPIAAGQVALNKKQRSVGCALVNIGAETVSIAVFENEVPISLQIFPIGSTDITNDIALGLKVPLDEAERIKLSGPSTYPKKKLDDIIEARLYDIFELIEAHLKKIGRNGLLPAGIILTGGGVGIATIEDLAKAVLKLPSSIAHPALTAGNKNPVKDSSWLVAYGLTLYALQKPEDVKPFLP